MKQIKIGFVIAPFCQREDCFRIPYPYLSDSKALGFRLTCACKRIFAQCLVQVGYSPCCITLRGFLVSKREN